MARYLSEQELQNLFENEMGWGSIEDPQAHSIFSFLMEAHSFTKKRHTVLDLGAGQLRYKPFVQHGNFFAIDFAQGDSTWDYSKLDIIADICCLPLKDNCADVILNLTTLEHINAPQLAINEMFRVLVPGGRLFMYAPFSSPMHQTPYDFYRYSKYGLEHLFNEAGFITNYIKPSNSYCYTSYIWFQQALTKVFNQDKLEEVRKLLEETISPGFKKYEDFAREHDYPDEPYPMLWMCECKKPEKFNKAGADASLPMISDIIACPRCKSEFNPETQRYFVCRECNATYSYLNNIPNLV